MLTSLRSVTGLVASLALAAVLGVLVLSVPVAKADALPKITIANVKIYFDSTKQQYSGTFSVTNDETTPVTGVYIAASLSHYNRSKSAIEYVRTVNLGPAASFTAGETKNETYVIDIPAGMASDNAYLVYAQAYTKDSVSLAAVPTSYFSYTAPPATAKVNSVPAAGTASASATSPEKTGWIVLGGIVAVLLIVGILVIVGGNRKRV